MWRWSASQGDANRPATAPPGVALPPGVAAVGDPQPPNGLGLGGFSSGMGILGAIGGGPSSGSASPVGGGSGGGDGGAVGGGFQAPPTDQSWGAIGGVIAQYRTVLTAAAMTPWMDK